MNTEAVAAFIKATRKQNSMTQLDIATKLNISPQAVSKWERGECLPDISLLPKIATIFKIKIEDILNAGTEDETSIYELIDMTNAFIDDELFEKIRSEFERAEFATEIRVPLDIFLALNNHQKEQLLEIIFAKSDYINIADDILHYINNSQRQKLVTHILAKKDYECIEPLMPFLSKAVKNEIIKCLLADNQFNYIEENLPFFSREQKNLIIEHIFTNNLDRDILEDYLPFFDMKQRNKIRMSYER